VLQAYFLAVVIHHRGVGDLVRWAMSKPADQEPVKLLQPATAPNKPHGKPTRKSGVWLCSKRVEVSN
jgi:hypothetical protein